MGVTGNAPVTPLRDLHLCSNILVATNMLSLRDLRGFMKKSVDLSLLGFLCILT